MYYYENYNRGKKQSFYFGKIKELVSQKDLLPETREYIEHVLERKKSKKIFYSKFPYRIDFLGYWGFEINQELENSQLAN
jgi:hypothetical protein